MRRSLLALFSIALLATACNDPVSIPRLPEVEDEEPDTGEGDMTAIRVLPDRVTFA
jgi:hypothetical protein